ncbi:MAG: 3-hydroxyacyl-CoA dehydrogenase family protein [Candidatus Cyclobacteriaceae bacterium M3_2C_046]
MEFDQIKKVTVLGTGNMGPGIAYLFAKAGYNTFMWGRTEQSTKKGEDNLRKNLDDMLREELISSEEAGQISKNVHVVTDLGLACDQTGFISEAIPENLELKQEIFSRLEALAPENAIISSNTSTLLPSQLKEKMRHPERFLVAHFWNPAYLAPLVEVCGSADTTEEVINTTMKLLKLVGNEPVRMKKEILGYIGNRIMHAMNREALYLIGEGIVSPEDVDKVILSSFGPRFANLGPMEYLDFSGLDLIKSIQGYLYGDLDTTPGVLPVVEQKNEAGDLGLKTGKGLFDWSGKDPNLIRANRDKEFMRKLKDKKSNK